MIQKKSYGYLNINQEYEGLYKAPNPSYACKKIFKKLANIKDIYFFNNYTEINIKCYDTNKLYSYSCKYIRTEPKIYKTFIINYKIICKKIYENE